MWDDTYWAEGYWADGYWGEDTAGPQTFDERRTNVRIHRIGPTNVRIYVERS